MTVEDGPSAAAVAAPHAVDGRRRRRKTMAPGKLAGVAATSAGGAASHFDVLIEDASDDGESCASDVLYDAAMEVIVSLLAPEWSTVVWQGRRTNEEFAANFWADIVFPTPASRFWENRSPAAANAGTSNGVCLCMVGSDDRSEVGREGPLLVVLGLGLGVALAHRGGARRRLCLAS
jgi:hypothetical protein